MHITGSLRDLAAFRLLTKLSIPGTLITGDIREISAHDFCSLKDLQLNDYIYGGGELNSIADAEPVMRARYELSISRPGLFGARRLRLSESSPDWYEHLGPHYEAPPFWVESVKYGPRVGWRWTNAVTTGDCETHWFNEQPLPGEDGYADFVKAKTFDGRMDDRRRFAGVWSPLDLLEQD
jgi:hypothetical protein